jgi:demethylmenaquinone methyltransferase/2-methoxy-6-polyprenyl-1,4-benzoquinol methylase
MPNRECDLYNPQFVSGLFDEMSRTYGFVNWVSSFGFCQRWRHQCVRAIPVKPGMKVLDLMTGMGELCPDLAKIIGKQGMIQALDLSPAMCKQAMECRTALSDICTVHVIQANALACPLDDKSVDYIFSSFGLKTFNDEQLAQLAGEMFRVLRPGGAFSLLEISVPSAKLLRWPYLFYLRCLIPLIGWLFKGNPDNYRYLGIYTLAFGNCEKLLAMFGKAGFDVQLKRYFFGCATGLVGSKPQA